MDEKEIVYNDFVDINVAVASERGCVYYGCYLLINRHDDLTRFSYLVLNEWLL